MQNLLLALAFINFSCKNNLSIAESPATENIRPLTGIIQKQIEDSTSWEFFLQHLPEKKGPVVDYKGKPVDDQGKHFALINYDVGTRDLQQCADALMRLRAEYLFKQKRFDEIGFHFTNGNFYSFANYCAGKQPVAKGREVVFISSSSHPKNAQSLRNYLDIVYTYAGTISLANELKSTSSFGIGTVVITPGSPGHCFIITNEAVNSAGEKLYKLVEGYTPAQSIYVLKNLSDASLGYWHALKKGPIETASYQFNSYKLKTFE